MVTISSKGQIVIPKKILNALGLKEQDKLLLFNKAEAKGLTERDRSIPGLLLDEL